jgi:hypothetical protein
MAGLAEVLRSNEQANAKRYGGLVGLLLSEEDSQGYNPFMKQTPGAEGNNPMALNTGGQPIPKAPHWVNSLTGLVEGSVNGFMAPYNAMTGKYDQFVIDPETGKVLSMIDPRLMDDAAAMAGLVTTSGMPMPKPAGALGVSGGTLWHPISDTKLKKPLSEIDTITAPGGVSLLPDRALNYESLLGQKLIAAVGDLSSAGKVVKRIDGTDIEVPVVTEGGKAFMRADRPGEVWANASGPASMFQRKIDEAGADGSKVNLVYTTMGHGAVDSSTMMGDAIAEMVKLAPIPRAAAAEFDKTIRAKFPNFVGITSPELPGYLRKASGAERNEIAKTMATKAYADLGFPDVAAMRYALIDGDLLGAPSLMSGAAISQVKPGADLIRAPKKPHSTYDTHIAGDYAGSAPMVPYSVMFPDWVASRAEKNAGLGPGTILNRDGRAMMMSPPTQVANQQWLDGLLTYLATRKPE